VWFRCVAISSANQTLSIIATASHNPPLCVQLRDLESVTKLSIHTFGFIRFQSLRISSDYGSMNVSWNRLKSIIKLAVAFGILICLGVFEKSRYFVQV